jgi:hypothetical protein
MQWWNDLIDWTSSDTGWRVLSGAVIPFLAIVVAGIVAALIGRGATKRVVSLHEHEAKNAAVAGLVSAARKAATWGSLGHDERAYADHLAEDADIRLRLLPVSGASIAANWAQHEIADIKKNSSSFSYQADQSLAEFRDRMLEWQARPARARKLFKSDLERWKFDAPDPDADLVKRQQDWNADKADASRAPEPAPTPTTTSLRPAQPAVAPATPASGAGNASRTVGSAGVAGSGRAPAPVAAPTSPVRPAGPSYGSEATVPVSDNVTRPYSEGETTPIRPTLGSPAFGSSAAGSSGRGWTAARDAVGDRSTDATRPIDTDNDDVVDDVRIDGVDRSPSSERSPVPRSGRNDLPFGRTAERDRVQQGDRRPDDRSEAEQPADRRFDAPRVDAPGTTNTTSIPTRGDTAPAEPADADETSEAPYANPVSASELRRRSEDDDE